MSPTIEDLERAGVIGEIGTRFARRMGRLLGEGDVSVLSAAALAASRASEAHVCVDLREVAGTPIRGLETVSTARWPILDPWRQAIVTSSLCRTEGSPLVLDEDRLYLRGHYEDEVAVAARILERVTQPRPEIDSTWLTDRLQRLFPGPTPEESRRAAGLALAHPFSVVTGGPGTGKTWTATRILALIAEHLIETRGIGPRALLLAPTGKAAARLRESVVEGSRDLAVDDTVRDALPSDASTIHRALATSDGVFLRTDVVIVDEASMIALPLMRRLLDAVPLTARLVLLGDDAQLASVEAGSVLGDLCEALPESTTRTPGRDGTEAIRPGQPALPGLVTRLSKSHRFADAPGIGLLASAFRTGRFDQAIDVLASEKFPEVTHRTSGLTDLAKRGYEPYTRTRDPDDALDALERFRVICAHRRGPLGSEDVVAMIEDELRSAGLLRSSTTAFYDHRPLTITANDPSTGLFNGDVAVVLDGSVGRAAYVRGSPKEHAHRLATARLPEVETAFATTVHKAQGAEVDEVVLVLPSRSSPVVTRELLYTAVTRARHRVVIFGAEEVLRQGITASVERASGLADRLRGGRHSVPEIE